jgi:hypothetical protein
MAFENRLGDRAEAKELFCHLQRIRAAKEPIEHVRTVDLCRQADEALKPSENDREQNRSVDLQEHAIRNAQEAARRTETHERHDKTSTRFRNASRGAGGKSAWGWSGLMLGRDPSGTTQSPIKFHLEIGPD